ncbi:MAG: GAF domain-containing sensor histidine kinase [Chloroflexi bacterium]|nr:GAF domain-containing sensor histidine kinase [Chloroflexota bacterium]
METDDFSELNEFIPNEPSPEVTDTEMALDQYSPASPFLISSLVQILNPLCGLLNLDACEVYLRNKRNGEMERVYHSGKIDRIWELDRITDKNSFLSRVFQKNENPLVHLPNRRFVDLSPVLQSSAYGQAAAYPIFIEQIPSGIFALAHTRRNMLSDSEQQFFRRISEWIAGIISFERGSQQQRAKIISEERERIGMDLHDGIIQSLYGIGLSMENARLGVENGRKDTIKQINLSLEALQSAIADIRAYILDLRPRQLRHSNIFEGMQSLIREFRANTMIEVELDGTTGEVAGLEEEQIEAIYHIFQEALSNIAKHAKATKVSVRLWRREDRLMLRILDNGKGIEASQQPRRRVGYGLTNMQARAEGVGGGLEIISIRNQGTQLTAWVPLGMNR